MEISGHAVIRAASKLDERFSTAAGLIARHQGKIILTGVGKSGRVAESLAATFSSTGTPAVFLHAGEALHGDSGVVQAGDPVIAVSKSGNSYELVQLASMLVANSSPIVAIVGNPGSPLAAAATCILDASVESESDPYNLVPSASSGVALALGQALAIAVMTRKGFNPAQFADRHPEGDLGRLLTKTVGATMLGRDSIACVAPSSSLREVLIEMTRWPAGAACVVEPDGKMAGLITEGDIRRSLERFADIHAVKAADVMTRTPVRIRPEANLFEALQLMENRPRQLSVLPVVDDADGLLLGLLRLHDVVRTQVPHQ